jgi:hypothetical protein
VAVQSKVARGLAASQGDDRGEPVRDYAPPDPKTRSARALPLSVIDPSRIWSSAQHQKLLTVVQLVGDSASDSLGQQGRVHEPSDARATLPDL